MRPVVLVLALTACSGGGDGAVLTFDAPDGPSKASRIEIVLASADEASMTEARQRMRPGMPTEEDVIYYRQRSPVDAIVGISSLAGFEVRIEPDESFVPDETFIPFALIYDEQDALIGVGSVNDADGVPSAVIIKAGMVVSYNVTVTALAAGLDNDAALTAGEGHAVDCENNEQSWRSGAVWKGASGPQIRLLLPDVGADPAATDAMQRTSDLDCDRYSADQRDCDDLRTAYHAGQTETCDGQDTDCDGKRMELLEGCMLTNNLNCSAMGVQLCSEPSGETMATGVCTPTAVCGCARPPGGGPIPPGCNSCSLLAIPGSSGLTPCAPSVGKLHIEECAAAGCTIEVVDIEGPWEIKIGPQIDGPFSGKLTGITTGYYYIRANYLGTATFPIGSPTIGAAYVGIQGLLSGRPVVMPVNLDFKDQVTSDQCAATGINYMTCYP